MNRDEPKIGQGLLEQINNVYSTEEKYYPEAKNDFRSSTDGKSFKNWQSLINHNNSMNNNNQIMIVNNNQSKYKNNLSLDQMERLDIKRQPQRFQEYYQSAMKSTNSFDKNAILS